MSAVTKTKAGWIPTPYDCNF